MSSSWSLSLRPRGCEYCNCSVSLLRCAGCKAIYYCSQVHQKMHRPAHRAACNAVRKALTTVVKEEIVFRATQFGGASIDTAPTNGADLFNQFLEAQRYTTARARFIEVLLDKFGRSDGRRQVVEAALEHSMKLIIDTGEDSYEVGRFIPALLLRLGKDQHAYDFLKWHVVVGPEEGWDNPPLGHLSTCSRKDADGADVLEYPQFQMAGQPTPWPEPDSGCYLSMLSALTLIKLRIYYDLRDIQNTFRALDGFVVPEILDLIRGELLTSAITTRPDVLRRSKEEISKLIVEMQVHIINLYDFTCRHNEHFWTLMFDSEEGIRAMRPPDDKFMQQEAWDYVTCCQPSWAETYGALGTMRHVAELRKTNTGYFRYEYVPFESGHDRLVAKEVLESDPA